MAPLITINLIIINKKTNLPVFTPFPRKERMNKKNIFAM